MVDSEGSVRLGFLKKPTYELKSEFFPSKVGGEVAWLSQKNLPDLSCKNCGAPMVFLLQVYAPIDDNDDAFHRTIFVFFCTQKKCAGLKGTYRAFRSQLKIENEFFSHQAPDIAGAMKAFKEMKIKEKNSKKSAQKVTSTDATAKDGEEEEKKNIPDGEESKRSEPESDESSPKETPNASDYQKITTEFELDIYSEEEEVTKQIRDMQSNYDKSYEDYWDQQYIYLASRQDQKLIQKMLKNYAKEYVNEAQELESEEFQDSGAAAGGDNEDTTFLDIFKGNKVDKHFLVFNYASQQHPKQVLRYTYYSQNGPLWYLDKKQIKSKEVPKCPNCRSTRKLEFQIMPQILNFVEFAEGVDPDWGVINVYSCRNHCVSDTQDYLEEFVHKQDSD